jgi:hypothetical protein
MLDEIQRLPRDAELLAFEAGHEGYCEREIGEINSTASGCTCIVVVDRSPDRALAGLQLL